ncbi:putative odorant receptor 83c isoform X1 [Drosophila virilis]|uniref:putative odorant receptor 83c isoform X1 n=1 Tax=Drosophila virilis TaxID=7244 RepID=UPI0038B2720C
MRFVRFISGCIGVDAYDPSYRFNTITAFTTGSIIMYMCFTIVTVFKEFKENWMFLIQAFATTGSVVQGINKLCVGILSARTVSELYLQIENIYLDFEKNHDPRYPKALLHNCRKLRRVLLLVGVSYVIGVCGIILTTVVASIVTGQTYLSMHFHLPGLDVNTKLGGWMTQAVHCICVVIGGTGLYAGDMVIIVYLLQSFVYADFLKFKVDALNTHVNIIQNDKLQCQTSEMLVDIARWHQIFTTFIAKCNDMFFILVSVQVASSALCIVITIFALLTSEWLGGYCYLCILVSNLYLYCVLGTMLESCNDNVMYEMYNISFYDLSAEHQRFVLFMLVKSQQPGVIRLLGVMPLSVSSALQVSEFCKLCHLIIIFPIFTDN